MSRARKLVLATLALAALVVVAGVVISFLPTKDGHSIARSAFGDRSPNAGSPATNPRSSASGPGSAATGGEQSQDNSLMTSGSGAEPIPTSTPTPYRLPRPTQPPAALTVDDLAVAPNSKVTSKSVSADGTTTQVAIDATTNTKTTDTIAYYQNVFTSLGMTGKPVPAIGGSTALTFTRGKSVVTLTVSSSDKGSRYLIYGVLRADA